MNSISLDERGNLILDIRYNTDHISDKQIDAGIAKYDRKIAHLERVKAITTDSKTWIALRHRIVNLEYQRTSLYIIKAERAKE